MVSPPQRSPRGLALPGLVFALLAGGCGDDKPYVPYAIDASARPAPAAAASAVPPATLSAAPSASAPRAAFLPVAGRPATEGGKSWAFEAGGVAAAPKGRAFAVGLELDGDGDGVKDLLAWAKSPDELRGELTFVSGKQPSESRTVVAMPAELATVGCTTQVGLAVVGPSTVALELAARCSDRENGRPARWVGLVRLAAPGSKPSAGHTPPELLFELQLAPTPAAESLAIAIDASDVDGDGRDDVSATFTLSGSVEPFGATSAASARLRFFDRPAGLSRDAAEPDASFRATVGSLVADAPRKKAAPGVSAGARAVRRLYQHLCSDGGRALLTTSAGGVRCGDGAFLADAAYAEAVAAWTVGDPLLALDATARAEGLGSEKWSRRKELAKQVEKGLRSSNAKELVRATATPAPVDTKRPAWGSLAFENAGHLLLRTATAVVRLDGTTLQESPAPEIPRWEETFGTGAKSEAGTEPVLSALAQRCDRPTLVAEISEGAGKDAPRVLPLPISTPVGADGFPAPRCAPLSGLPLSPIDARGGRLWLALGTVTLELDVAKPVPAPEAVTLPTSTSERRLGSVRSPDGATLALPSTRGLVLRTGTSTRLLPSLTPDRATGCVPSNGGARVACLVGGAAVLYDTP
jgi:hypothetical protein